MHYVYLLECSDGTFYTGCAKDVAKRVEQHNKGVGAKYTRGRRPVKLLGCKEFQTQSDAMRAELVVKSLPKQLKFDYFFRK